MLKKVAILSSNRSEINGRAQLTIKSVSVYLSVWSD